MYIENDKDWEDLYKRAKERLQEARLNLLAAESALPEIEDELCRIELNKNGVTWKHRGKVVLVNFKGAPGTPMIYQDIFHGRIRLKRISKRTGKALKSGQGLSWEEARFVEPGPNRGDTEDTETIRNPQSAIRNP